MHANNLYRATVHASTATKIDEMWKTQTWSSPLLKKETCEQTLFTPALSKVPLMHAWAHLPHVVWNDAVFGIWSSSSSEIPAPQPRQTASQTKRKPERSSSPPASFARHQLTTPSTHPTPSHGNIITMATHHSNPTAALKGNRNASTRFTFLKMYERSPELWWSQFSQLEQQHLHDFCSAGKVNSSCAVATWTIMEERKLAGIWALPVYFAYGDRWFLRCLPQTYMLTYTSLSFSVTRMYLPTWDKKGKLFTKRTF